MIVPRFAYFFFIILYFIFSWGVNWPALFPETTISSSYLFDFIYAILILIYLKKLTELGALNSKSFIVRSCFMLFVSVASIYVLNHLEVLTPFKYIDNLVLQLLILAPIMEELVFRGAFVELIGRSRFKAPIPIALNAGLFSFSHLGGILVLPPEFHHFIYIQAIYTFFMGWVLTKSRLESRSFIEPIILHFIFNLIFYGAVIFEFI